MSFPEAAASSMLVNTPRYEAATAVPLLCAVTRGLILQTGFLSFAFFKASVNSLDASISLFILPMLIPLGSDTVFVILPYSTLHETLLPSSNSGKSAALSMRNSSKVLLSSSIFSVAPAYSNTAGFSSKGCSVVESLGAVVLAGADDLIGAGVCSCCCVSPVILTCNLSNRNGIIKTGENK
jgi:hypothetical protein